MATYQTLAPPNTSLNPTMPSGNGVNWNTAQNTPAMANMAGRAPSGTRTAEGLNVRNVNTVPIDPTTGQPTAQALGQALIEPNGFTNNNKAQDQLSAPAQAFAYDDPVPATPAVTAINQAAPASGQPGAAWTGGWGSDAIGRFLAGDPGQVDWSIANQGMTQKPLIGPAVPYAATAATPKTGLAAVGSKRGQTAAPAQVSYKQALSNAAAKMNTAPEAIHAQLMRQQTGNKPNQIYAFTGQTGNDSAGRSSGMNGIGVNTTANSYTRESRDAELAEKARRTQLAAQGR